MAEMGGFAVGLATALVALAVILLVCTALGIDTGSSTRVVIIVSEASPK